MSSKHDAFPDDSNVYPLVPPLQPEQSPRVDKKAIVGLSAIGMLGLAFAIAARELHHTEAPSSELPKNDL